MSWVWELKFSSVNEASQAHKAYSKTFLGLAWEKKSEKFPKQN